MTEYQFYDLIIGTNSNLIDLITIFFSIFVAYVVCIYLVGSKLSKSRSIAITIVYSVFSLFLVSLVYESLSTQGQIIDGFSNIEDASVSIGFIIGPATLLSSWLLSVIYMLQVQNQKNN